MAATKKVCVIDASGKRHCGRLVTKSRKNPSASRYRDMDGDLVNVNDYVHETPTGRWVVAVWSERNAQWSTDNVTSASARSGFSGAFARRLQDLDTPKYASKAAAVRAAARVYGWDPA